MHGQHYYWDISVCMCDMINVSNLSYHESSVWKGKNDWSCLTFGDQDMVNNLIEKMENTGIVPILRLPSTRE